MTPERIASERLKEIASKGPESDECHVTAADHLTWGELRFLLAIAQRAGETCEWVPEDWANFKAAQFQTDCGRKIHSAHDRSRPCWCGRTVAVRDGRT